MTTWASSLALRRYKEIEIFGRINVKEEYERQNQCERIFVIDFGGFHNCRIVVFTWPWEIYCICSLGYSIAQIQ